MARDVPNKHILDTSVWNELYKDPNRDAIVQKLRTTVILPTSIAITELAAIQDQEKRTGILQPDEAWKRKQAARYTEPAHHDGV